MGASGLGSLLVKEGFLTEQDRLTITKTCGQGSWAFAKSILAVGLLDEDELAAFFAERTRYQIAPKDFLHHLDQSAIHALDKRLVSKLEVIPLKKDPGKITVGVVDPLDRSTLKQLEFFTGLEVDPVVIPLSQLYEGLLRIDPDFKLQPTALTHFLQNHAQSAWVRQKLDSDEDLGSTSGRKANPNDIEEIYDDMPEIEEIQELDDEVVDEEAELEMEMDEAEAEAGEEIDPFAGLASGSQDDDLEAEISARSASETDDLLERIGDDEDKESETLSDPANSDLDFDMDLAELETEEGPSDAKTAAPGPGEGESDDEEKAVMAMLEDKFEADEDGNLSAEAASEKDEFDFENHLEAPEALSIDPNSGDMLGFDESDDQAMELTDDDLEVGSNVKKLDPADSDEAKIQASDDDFDFAMDDIAPDAESKPMAPMSSFGFEETKPREMQRAKGPDVLDNLDDPHEPSLDVSALAAEQIDKDLLADLHAEIEADDHTPGIKFDGPNTNAYREPAAFETPKATPQKAKASAPSFLDEEDTHIDLRSSPLAGNDSDDDDIQLHPKAAKDRQQSDSGLNPTSALNEIILKLSLSYSAEGVLKVLQGSLYKIGEAGCFINTKSQRQILWSDGRLISEEIGPAALLPLLKGASSNRWNNMELKASESWSQQAMKLRIFRMGDWLWAHHVKASDDTAIFRETVESTVSQVADKLGAG